MDKKDITLYSKYIIGLLLNRYGNFLSDEVKEELLKYYDKVSTTPGFEEDKMHNLQFLFLSTSFLMNEGLVHRKKLEELLKNSVAEDIDLDIHDEFTSYDDLVLNNSRLGKSISAKDIVKDKDDDEDYSVVIPQNHIPGNETKNDLKGFINFIDSLSGEEPPYSIVKNASGLLMDYYNSNLINIIDFIDENLISRFIGELESLYDDTYESEFSLLDEENDDYSFNNSADDIDTINEEFIENYGINLFDLLKQFSLGYIDSLHNSERTFNRIVDEYDALTPEEDKPDVTADVIKDEKEENSAIFTRNLIDPVKLIIFTRNALAHNNYEFVGKDHIRLYRTIVEDQNGRIIETKDLSEKEIKEHGGAKTIFNVTMSLGFLKKISDRIEQACHDEYELLSHNQNMNLHISPNFIYDELFNKEFEKNSVYTGDADRIDKYKNYYSFAFLTLSLLNANLMVLHNIDLNQGRNDISFDDMILGPAAEEGYINKLINITSSKITNINNEKNALLIKSNGKPTEAARSKILLEEFMKGEKNKKFNKSFRSDDIKTIIRQNNITELTTENIDFIIEKLEEQKYSTTRVEENKKFAPVVNINKKVKDDIDMLLRIQNILVYEKKDTVSLEADLLKLENAKARLLAGDRSAIKKYENGEEFSKYILRNARIALAHGTIRFSKDKKDNKLKALFVNYDRDNKTQLIFEGKMDLDSLLKSVINEEHLDYLMQNYIQEQGPIKK